MSTPEAAQPGPCTPWITADDVAASCDALEHSGDPSVYDDAALQASQLLYELSGRQFSGECGPVTVRPCTPGCGCWSAPYIGWPYSWDWYLGCWASPAGDRCGCSPLSTVKLAGSVREVSEVKIDGVALDPSEYRVDKRKYLVRLADDEGDPQRWPGCQRLDLDDTEESTWSVTYTFGQDVPAAGVSAAVELACQLAEFGVTGDCALPAGVTKVTRQGITIDLEKAQGDWWAVLPLVAAFLKAYNPAGLRRRAALWSPDVTPFAQRVGQ